MKIRALSDSPFSADVLPFRRRADQWELAVVAKATYALERGACRLLRQPIPVFSDERRFDDLAASIYAPRDLVPCKQRPEVVVVGAHDDAQIRLPGRAPQPLRPPLAWPPPGADAGAPWHVTDLASSPLGEEFDGSVFQYAPVEQRLDVLSLTRPVVLERARPGQPAITLVFPPIEPAARIETLESTARPLVMTPELLWVDVERGVSTVTWRGTTTTDFADGFEVVLGTSEGGDIEWPTRRDATVSPTLLWDEDDDDPIELPTAVAATLVAGDGPPSSAKTYTGEHPVARAHDPAWLAQPTGAHRAVGAALVPEPEQEARPSSPPPLPAALGAQPHPPHRGRQPIVPHPAREMIADPREVSARSPKPAEPEPPKPAPPPILALDVFWRDDACDDLAKRERGYQQLFAADAATARHHEPDDPWWEDDVDEDDGLDDLGTDEMVMLVLRDASPMPLVGLERALMRALHARRAVSAPLGMLAGELKLPFDARAELEVYLEAARPLAKSDKPLAAILEHVGELLETPLVAVQELARGQRARIARQWRAANRDLPADFLERSAHEILLQRRSFDTRDVFDEPHLRALLVNDDAAVPLYLPEAATRRLPLFSSFSARVIAELMPKQDEREPHPVSLRAMAVARVVDT